MANEIRVRGNLTSGTLSVALAAGDTTMSSAGLASLPGVTSAGHAVIVIENELVYVTAHTGAATTATILRGQEGTTAASHALNVAWLHGPVASDYDSVLGYVESTTTQTLISTEVALTGLSLTVTVPYAGHRLRFNAGVMVQSTAANDRGILTVKESTTYIATARTPHFSIASIPLTAYLTGYTVPTAGAHTYTVNLAEAGAAGTLSTVSAALGSGSAPGFFMIEDLGPSI